MPLRKLWNSICGSSTKPSADPKSVAATSAPSTAESAGTVSAGTVAAEPPKVLKRSRGITLTREAKKICRLIPSSTVGSVLEVSVGDGSRAAAILQSLRKAQPETTVRYIAVDLFELGGNPLSLREFHRQLREQHAQAQLVPMPTPAGLQRVAHTFGSVDLILWGAQRAPGNEELRVLARLCKPETTCLSIGPDGWLKVSQVNQLGASLPQDEAPARAA
ncbi:hypothetical protein FYK55_07855 [Roseiconus nitratireducens]|uniref:Uncharacterized protein n=1 Tax=Roseiconus nitratireducens TaxID=2605748 RepID=A0A5M6DDE8_9BACT|nr:hypothetical protein [Roseiconus nitratireducens]KAA5545544.1 hypothetical protein FYK55_07855 [Roseiconus nitratireducens]